MVLGFHIKEDGTRVPMTYNTDLERAWCESAELLEHKHYAEAHEKLDEYHDINGGLINKYDWMHILKIEVGFLNVEPSEHQFKNSVYAWNSAAFYGEGDDFDYLAELANDIVDHYKRHFMIPVECDDFTHATVTQTTKLLEFMYSSFLVPGAEHRVHIDQYSDFLYIICNGIEHLMENGQVSEARGFYDNVLGAPFGAYKRFMEKNNPFENTD